MNKIDPHHHLWDITSNKYAWLTSPVENNFLGDYRPLQNNYLLNDYLNDCARQQIIKSVHIQAGYDRTDCVGETKWLQQLADQHGFPHGIVAYANLATDNLDEILNAHCQYPNIRGIRQCLNWHTDPFYKDCSENFIDLPAWQKGFALLEKYNLSFDMQIYPQQMISAFHLAKHFPHINIIIDHMGLPFWQDDNNLIIWQDRLAAFSTCKNVSIKLSGFGMLKPDWQIDDIKPWIQFIIDTFGTQRCMFASNFPVDGLYVSYDTLYNAYQLISSDLSNIDQENLFYNTAAQVYRL